MNCSNMLSLEYCSPRLSMRTVGDHGRVLIVEIPFHAVHLSRLRSAVDQIQDIHRTVADVRNQIDPFMAESNSATAAYPCG